MNNLAFQIYGSNKSLNTFIGGIAPTISTKSLLATKLGISTSVISNFSIDGNDIRCKITGNYNIPAAAFSGDINITYFNDTKGLVNIISYSTFQSCTNLISVNFPNVTFVGGGSYGSAGAFYNCTNLTEVLIPKLSSLVDGNIFNNCTKLVLVDFPLVNSAIGNGVFFNCITLNSVNVFRITSVSNNAFGNTKIVSLDLSFATIIGDSAFQSCINFIQNLNLNLCTSIGAAAFSYTKIIGCYAPVCTFIGYQAFSNCSEVLTYNLPELLTLQDGGTFGQHFVNNTKVTSIYMPKVTSIGGSPSLISNTFQNIKLGCTITVPIAQQTVNAGSPEADLQYAITSRGATVIYV